MAQALWTVVVPLKGGPGAKSRLQPAVPGLATAIALDCLDAVAGCPAVARVIVVTADAELARAAKAVDAEVVAESSPGAGLPAAIRDALGALEPGTGPTAVLLGDLPALRPQDLAEALSAATEALTGVEEVFVPDADGVGTVLLAAASPSRLRPAFGTGSAAAHQAAGALRLDLALPRLRRDVDTDADLTLSRAWGLGRRTEELLP